MLINPFEITRSEPGKQTPVKEDGLIREIIDDLVTNQLELITDFQEAKVSDALVRAEIWKLVCEKRPGIPGNEAFTDKVLNSLFGYEVLQPYVDDPEVTDILVNNYKTIYIKKFGQKIRVPVDFGSEENFVKYLYKVAALCGGKIDENANAESIMSDRKRNMRVVISLRPTNVLSPTLCIRKHSRTYRLPELVDKAMLTEGQAAELRAEVLKRKNIIIAGQGGAGKTTLLGGLMEEIPHSERALFIQETFEVSPSHPDIVCKLVRLSDNPLVKEYTLFDLTKMGLLMSLDRLIIGELKDREAYDFFNAIFTGHEGSMATVHAPSAEQVVDRLLQLMSRAHSDIPYSVLRDMLCRSLDIVIFMKDFKVKEILYMNQGGECKF